jgi:Flp pilus assembly protein TadD
MVGGVESLNFTYDPAIWIHLGDSALDACRYAEAESWYLQALTACPQDADLLNNLGTAVWFLGRIDDAEAYYQRANRLEPDRASFLNNLGNIQRARGRIRDAEASYRRSLEIEPGAVESRMNLGVALSDLGRLEESERLLREALIARPDLPDIHLNLGTTLNRLGRSEEAIACYEETIRLRPNHAEAHRNRAMYWLALGDYDRGWPEYEWRWRCHGKGQGLGDRPVWNGEELAGRHLLLHAEQGFGDTLQFIRYARLVKERGARVTVVCAGPLVRILERCPEIDQVVPVGSAVPMTDYQVLLLSLPNFFRTTLDTIPSEIPYLRIPQHEIEDWERILGTGPEFKVGINWQGNPLFPGDCRRSVPLTAFEPIAKIPGVKLVRLQHGPGSEQLNQLDDRFVVDDPFGRSGLSDWDFLETAAVMKNLDLVLTVDSSIAHLAGAIGAPVWVALPFASDWRWLRDRDDSPWYPTLRLFRQERSSDWIEVFERIAESMRAIASPGRIFVNS